MQDADSWFGMVLTYLVGFYTVVMTHSSEIISFLGFVLLIARLVHDVPKAYLAIRGWFKPKE